MVTGEQFVVVLKEIGDHFCVTLILGIGGTHSNCMSISIHDLIILSLASLTQVINQPTQFSILTKLE